MAKLTKAEDMAKALRQSYDREYYDALYRQANYAFGEPWNAPGTFSSQDEVPDYPDIVVRHQEIGRSRRILNSQFIGLSRVMQSDPEPEWPQVDRWIGETRKQAYMARYYGDGYADGEWHQELANAFMEGDGLGIGFLKLGLITNPQSGMQRVTVKHSPTIQTIWDRVERNPSRARFISFLEYLPVDKAEQMWGRKKIEPHIRRFSDGQDTTELEVVRVFDCWDLGINGSNPTHMVIPSVFEAEPLQIEENPLGCLPVSYYIHMLAPGMRRPIGRIALQMSTQEALNEIEKYLRVTLKKSAIDIVDTGQIDESDLRKYNSGKQMPMLRRTGTSVDGKPAFERHPGMEAAQSLLILKDNLERQFNADSGVSDFDRGTLSPEKRTLGENQLVDQRSQVQQSWSDFQALQFHRRTAEGVSKLMMMFDRDPLVVDVFGVNVPLNDPASPGSTLESVFSEHSKVLIGADSFKQTDARQEQIERLQLIQTALTPLLQMGTINVTKYTEEVLKSIGETDTNEWIQMPEMAAQEDPMYAA